MVQSCSELINPHFGLKVFDMILGILASVFVLYPSTIRGYYPYIVNGYHFSYLTVIIALVVAAIWFDTSVATEICLLGAALIKLLVVTAIYADHNSMTYFAQEPVELVNGNGFEYTTVERANTKYYAFLIINIVSMILIVVDIILRLAKK